MAVAKLLDENKGVSPQAKRRAPITARGLFVREEGAPLHRPEAVPIRGVIQIGFSYNHEFPLAIGAFQFKGRIRV